MPAAGLVVDFGVRILHAGDVARGVALHDRELADDERGVRRVRVRDDLRDLVRDAAQEQVVALAADVGGRRRYACPRSCCTDAVYW